MKKNKDKTAQALAEIFLNEAKEYGEIADRAFSRADYSGARSEGHYEHAFYGAYETAIDFKPMNTKNCVTYKTPNGICHISSKCAVVLMTDTLPMVQISDEEGNRTHCELVQTLSEVGDCLQKIHSIKSN